METYLKHKSEINGYRDVLETVKTIEKIAASSIHLLKNRVANFNDYLGNIENILKKLSLYYQNKNHPLIKKKQNGARALIIITGNKGLVGNLWHALINSFLHRANEYHNIIVIGNKGNKYLTEEKINITNYFNGFPDSDINGNINIETITNLIFNNFYSKYRKVDILYSHFTSIAQQEPKLISFLPFEFMLTNDIDNIHENNLELPIFESSKKSIFNHFLKKYISIYFYKIILESKLSELSARTVAMEHAGVKTKEIIKNLDLLFKKDRRKIITQHQLVSLLSHKI